VKIDFGESKFEFDNWFLNIFVQQLFEYGIVVIENSAWFTGEYLFSNVLGPVMDTYLNHYTHTMDFANPFLGQVGHDALGLDYKNV